MKYSISHTLNWIMNIIGPILLQLAGLTILSNSFETPRREQEGCRSEVRSRRKRSARIEETAAG